MKRLKQLLLSVSASVSLLAPAALAPVALAGTTQPDIQNSTCNGSSLNLADTGGCEATSDGADSGQNLVTNIINIFSIIVGIIAVVMIIIGGFRYVTSGGDSNAVSGAKNTILYAIIGLIIVAFAQIIVRFVLNKSVVVV